MRKVHLNSDFNNFFKHYYKLIRTEVLHLLVDPEDSKDLRTQMVLYDDWKMLEVKLLMSNKPLHDLYRIFLPEVFDDGGDYLKAIDRSKINMLLDLAGNDYVMLDKLLRRVSLGNVLDCTDGEGRSSGGDKKLQNAIKVLRDHCNMKCEERSYFEVGGYVDNIQHRISARDYRFQDTIDFEKSRNTDDRIIKHIAKDLSSFLHDMCEEEKDLPF